MLARAACCWPDQRRDSSKPTVTNCRELALQSPSSRAGRLDGMQTGCAGQPAARSASWPFKCVGCAQSVRDARAAKERFEGHKSGRSERNGGEENEREDENENEN